MPGGPPIPAIIRAGTAKYKRSDMQESEEANAKSSELTPGERRTSAERRRIEGWEQKQEKNAEETQKIKMRNERENRKEKERERERGGWVGDGQL